MVQATKPSRIISNAAVKKATGKDWQFWFTVLDDMDLYDMRRALVEEILDNVYGLSDGWAQQVTQRYAQERELN